MAANFKVWATNDVPTATELNDYWQEQVLIRGTAAELAALASPAEGWHGAATDTDRIMIYNGSAWVRLAHYAAAGRTGVIVRRAANQSINDTTSTDISWDTEDFDSDGSITVASGTITVQAAAPGLYEIHGTVRLAGTSSAGVSTTNHITVTIVRGGVTLHFTGPLTSDATYSDGSDLWVKIPSVGPIDLTAGDTIKVSLYHNTGSARNVIAWLWAIRTGL